jgi:diguanylate cyclase (GGDEF)-like protein
MERRTREEQLTEHIWKLLRWEDAPGLPEDLRMTPLAEDIHRGLCEIRRMLQSYADWDLEPTPKLPGIVSECLKGLQANLRQQEAELRRQQAALQREAERQPGTAHELQERDCRFRFPAGRDPLTGALNRKSFFYRAASELETAYVHKTRVCLAIIDLDNFKQFNDRHGPLAGEEALKHTARVVAGELRRTDFLGRYGDEELVALFPGTGLEPCRLACDRALRRLAATPVQLESGLAVLTASAGLAETDWEARAGEEELPDFSAEWMSLATRADFALYEAKRSGRNRAAGSREPGIARREPGIPGR